MFFNKGIVFPLYLMLLNSLATAGCHQGQTGKKAEPMADPSTHKGDGASDADRKCSEPDCSKLKCVALTFDDGPSAYTPGLLKILDDYGVKATFFVLGSAVKEFPETLSKTASAGHEIGNHTWSHPFLRRPNSAKLRQEIDQTQEIIRKVTGKEPQLMRPPFGNIAKWLIAEVGLPAILWSLDTWDWKRRNTDDCFRTVTEKVQPGDIVLMHDSRPTTIAAVPQILAELKESGYTLVTVSQLLAKEQPTAGKTYRGYFPRGRLPDDYRPKKKGATPEEPEVQ